MSEVQRLRMELKTDIELIAIRQGDMAQGMERFSSSLEAHGQRIDAQGRQIAELASELNRNHQETARLGREIAEGQRWTQGRMRQMGERFDALFGAIEQENAGDHDLLMDLRDRVESLEKDRPPAA